MFSPKTPSNTTFGTTRPCTNSAESLGLAVAPTMSANLIALACWVGSQSSLRF